MLKLTPRELQVLEGVVDGKMNREIAAELGISTDTVKHHISHLVEKFPITPDRTSHRRRRTELAVYAITHWLLPPKPIF